MPRLLTIAAMFVLALSSLAAAEEHHPPATNGLRYGPDLLLVNVTTGQVVDAVYDVAY